MRGIISCLLIGSANTQPANKTANTMPLCCNKSNRRGVKCSAWKSNKLVCYQSLIIHSEYLIKIISGNHSVLSCQGQRNTVCIQNDKPDIISGLCACLQQMFLYLCSLLKTPANLNHRGERKWGILLEFNSGAFSSCDFHVCFCVTSAWLLNSDARISLEFSSWPTGPSGSQPAACQNLLCLRDRHAWSSQRLYHYSRIKRCVLCI